MTSKLVAEAIRVYSYQLARELIERTVAQLAQSDELAEGGSGGQQLIQKESTEERNSVEVAKAIVPEADPTATLAQQLAEKDALINELRSQLESLQQQMTTLQRSSAETTGGKRRMRSLHNARAEASIKVNEEDVDSCSDKVFLSRKSSVESLKSHKSNGSREMQKVDKTPSLCDLVVQAEEKKVQTEEKKVQASKPNIFNVEYEEFAQQLKAELSPSTPSDSNLPEDFASPDFRRKDSKPVLNWSNLQSPRDHPTPPGDSLALKEAEKPQTPSIWAEKPKPKTSRSKPPKGDLSINLEAKARARSQSRTVKQPKERQMEEKKGNRENARSAGTGRARRSTPGSKGYSPRSAGNPGMAMTTMNFPSARKDTAPSLKDASGSSSFRARKYSSRTHISDDSPLPNPSHKALDDLLFNEEDSANWQNIMRKMKENPALISKLIRDDGVSEKKEKKLVFTRVSATGQQQPVKALLPMIDRWGADVSGRDLNCVLEEDEDSSRSHFDPLPELAPTKQQTSFRNEDASVGPILKASRKQPTSAPKPRAVSDWSESSLDSFVLGGTTAFNWDHRNTIFTEREIDVAYLKLHGTQLDPAELKTICAKGRQTLARLRDELMLVEESNSVQTTIESGVSTLKQVKKLLAFRKATVKILELVHQREDQLLTLMSLEDENSSEGETLSKAVAAVSSEILSRITQWKAMGFSFTSFRYLHVVSTTQDYAQKIEEEAASAFSMKHFGFR